MLVIFVALSVPGATASGQSLCISPRGETPPFLPDENETLLRVEALAEYVPDVLEPESRRAGPPRGQAMAVEELEGPGRAALDPDSLVIVVQWGHPGALHGCHLVPTRDSLPAGTRHLLKVEIRPDSLWLDGRPTFDLRPGRYSDYTRHGRTPDAPSFAEYRALLDTLPSRTEWATDCRPGVEGVRRWLETHPETRRFSPFGQVIGSLRDYCLRSLRGHAERLERWEPTRPIPERIHEMFSDQGCLDDSTTLMTFPENVVDGRFVTSEAPQWALVCPGPGDWRLMVAVLESPPRVIELLDMVGPEWNWLVGTAPPEYLDWVCSHDTGSGRFRSPYPERDVVLLWEMDVEDRMLVFYETPAGWTHVRTAYCTSKMVGALQVRGSRGADGPDG